MKKKVISTFLAAALAVTLFAGTAEAGGLRNADEESDTEEYSTEIDMEEEPYTVAIQVVTMPGTDASDTLEAREEAINEITVPAINCKVDIQEIWISEIANTTSMGVAGNDKIDLIAVGTVQPLSSMVGSEMLLDMNEGNLLQNRGSELVSLFGETLESGNVSGKQLAIPAKVFAATERGIYYNKTIADAAGVEIPDKITVDELEEILTEIHEYDPSIYPYYIGDGTTDCLAALYQYETFGTNNSYGVILDAQNDLTVENIYASDLFEDYCLRMYRWKEEGLQPGDPTDTTTPQDYFASQQLFCIHANVNPQEEASFYTDDFELAHATLVDSVLTNAYLTEYMWGISTNCERPDKAMDFLNFLYSNADVANIMMYGLPDVNYEFVTDDIIKTNGTYNTQFYYGGNSADMLIEYPAGEDYVEQMEELQETAEISPILGYMFDDSDYQTESAVLSSTINQFFPQLQCGMAGSEEETLELIDEFNKALSSAGINEVVAANQEQLDAWLAEQ